MAVDSCLLAASSLPMVKVVVLVAVVAFMSKSDPTQDPEFQKVVRHFLTTPPKPHKPIGKKKASLKSKSGARRKGK
jgi:hypothetical protein